MQSKWTIAAGAATRAATLGLPLFIGALSLLGSTASAEPTACTDEATDLIAGRDINVGNVNVCNDATTLTITYAPNSPWCLLETNLQVATSKEDIPHTKKGYPKPDEFDYGDDYDCAWSATFEISLDEIGDGAGPGDSLTIAANAMVEDDHGNKEGAWGDGPRFVGSKRNWSMYFTYEVQATGPGTLIFVTSQTYSGDLVTAANSLAGDSLFDGSEGPEAGDSLCNALADDAGLQSPGDDSFVA